MNRLLLMLAFLLLVAGVAAQAPSRAEADYDAPGYAAYTTSHCMEYQVKSLYAATNLGQSLEEQEKLLNAAEAYGRLWELDQQC